MSVILKDIMSLMEEIAPARFKESYDNVGLMLGDKNAAIKSVLVTLDCTLEVIQEAIDKDCDLIVSHHPILFLKPSNINEDTLVGKKLRMLIKNDINVFSSHTNLDSVKGGMNDIVMTLLKYEDAEIMEVNGEDKKGNAVGVGRIYEFKEEKSLGEVIEDCKSAFECQHLRYAGELDWGIKKVAVVNGSGQDYFSLAKKLGADCIITGDTSYHYVSDYKEEKIAIIDAGHFDTEWPAMKYFGKEFEKIIKAKGLELDVKISEKNRNPYTFI